MPSSSLGFCRRKRLILSGSQALKVSFSKYLDHVQNTLCSPSRNFGAEISPAFVYIPGSQLKLCDESGQVPSTWQDHWAALGPLHVQEQHPGPVAALEMNWGVFVHSCAVRKKPTAYCLTVRLLHTLSVKQSGLKVKWFFFKVFAISVCSSGSGDSTSFLK